MCDTELVCPCERKSCVPKKHIAITVPSLRLRMSGPKGSSSPIVPPRTIVKNGAATTTSSGIQLAPEDNNCSRGTPGRIALTPDVDHHRSIVAPSAQTLRPSKSATSINSVTSSVSPFVHMLHMVSRHNSWIVG